MKREVAITRPAAGPASAIRAYLPAATEASLQRMFADPRLLDREERVALVAGLRACVVANPNVSEVRVLLGMALCVNLEVPEAIEELREGVRLAPDSFIAHLKMGELWMRLRACDKAEDHTRRAALLAQSALQSELARQQATKIRELLRNGIRRGGYTYDGLWLTLSKVVPQIGKWWRRNRAEGHLSRPRGTA